MTPDQALILVESTSSNMTSQLQHAQAVLGVNLHRLSRFPSLPDMKSTTSRYHWCNVERANGLDSGQYPVGRLLIF